jgi:hypothetical protein
MTQTLTQQHSIETTIDPTLPDSRRPWISPDAEDPDLALVFNWVGEVGYYNGTRTAEPHYSVRLERRYSKPALLGEIEFTETGWIITHQGRTPIPAIESLAFASYIEAATWLYHQHFAAKRQALRQALAQ